MSVCEPYNWLDSVKAKVNRYRQPLLLLVVLVLPCLALVVQSRRLTQQEHEISQTRIEEARKQMAAGIGQDMLVRLERIKLKEIANAPSGTLPQQGAYSDPAVLLVGWEDGDRLQWPWDVDSGPIQSHAAEDPEFAQKIEQAEHEEIAEKRDDAAVGLYRESIAMAHTDAQRASARLRLARVLTRSGAAAEARRIYRELLNLPANITDEFGLSFASYAATRLAESHTAEVDVLERVKRDMESSASLTPAQNYRLMSVLKVLEESPDKAIRESTGPVMERLSARIRFLERALDVQRNFTKLRVTQADWQPYSGGPLWLIGKAPTGAAARPLILVVDGEVIRKNVEADRLSRVQSPRFHIGTDGDSGELLDERLPDLRVAFDPGSQAEVALEINPQRSFYSLSLFFVVILTFFGGYLLWRDTRREGRIAELRSHFVSSVSHELKTPLTSIRMFAETMQMSDETGSTDPKQRAEYLDTIVSETERLTRLLNNVLDFSRVERGQKSYHLQSALLPAVIDSAVRTMRFPLAEQGFDLKVNVCEGIPPLNMDRDAMEQALLNLLSNAMKYSGKSRAIELRLCSQNGSALIQVADRGIGIPSEEQRRIFEKFYRVETKENRAISGTGLGLALVAHVAAAHGGSVEVQSKPGEGSTFSIRLPLNGSSAS